jgi:hypothetical protein
MQETVERLAESLLYEGYALYPYTPGATKNATPTPFGIAYPPAYAARQPAAFDHLQIQCVALETADDAELEAEVVFLQAAGSRHRATERRISATATLASLAEAPLERRFAFEPGSALGVATGAGADAAGALSGTLRLSAEPLERGTSRITARVENTTPLPEEGIEGIDRAAALRRSLLSTHTILELGSGRFASPLENEGGVGVAVQACDNVNSWPVLAAADDSAVLGAAILLPDHPRIAPQSRANMFDSTEIEEALTLHVQTLSRAERAAIAEHDPAIREMVERVERTTSEELLEMHGEMKPSDPDLRISGAPAFPEWSEPPDPDGIPPRQGSPAGIDPADVPGEAEVAVDGKLLRRGAAVVLEPGEDGDPYDKMLHGQRATIRRIYLDYDGRAYIGVTVDADPMAEVLRESGRYLFFFADELREAS